jgi:nicotinate-nucleotide pyrophosphorylase (carboxylating)
VAFLCNLFLHLQKNNMDYKAQLQQLIHTALQEDIGVGDHSTLCCIPASQNGTAILKVKENGLLAGMQVAEQIFKTLQPNCTFIPHKKDGDIMQYGDIAYTVEATVHTILQGERLALNCMQRMSGIATLTSQYSAILKPYKTKILDTRKTTPNFRLLEKEAVRIGGGYNHRMGLYDMIMLKDNHIDYCGGIEKAIEKANDYIIKNNYDLKIEVETRSIEDVKKVLAVGGVHRIMLDNYTPELVAEGVQLINGTYETEASGGINLTTVESYAKTEVDYVSCGAIIHQAVSMDLSLKAVMQ